MRRLILLFTLFTTPALAQPSLPLPQLFTVTGVAANDTLNVREAPSASAADIGGLRPDQTVEILALSQDGAWGMVSSGESTGWVSTRFLTPAQGTTGDGITLPDGVPLHMACSGAEPFWNAEISMGISLTITDYSYDTVTPKTYAMRGVTKPVNVGPYVYGFSSPPLAGVIRRQYCEDGMSEIQYGWTIDILQINKDGVYMESGCCQATLN